MLLMVALGGAASEHLSSFLSDLPEKDQTTLLGLLQGKLTILYHREGIRDWLTEFPELINSEALRLAKFLETNEQVGDYEALNLSRICALPTDLNIFASFVSRYQRCDKCDWIEQCLKIKEK